MARKRNAKSLFEIIGPGSGKVGKSLGVPGWFGQPAQRHPEAPTLRPAGEAEAAQPAPLRPPAPSMAPPPAEPILSASGGRVRISLNQVGAVVLVSALIGLIILAFILGRRSGTRAAEAKANEVRAGLNQEAARGPTSRPQVQPHPGAETVRRARELAKLVPDNYRREKGKYYLVIQDLVWKLEEAVDIKEFLYRRHGIKATIQRMERTKTYRIWDTKGFDSDRSRPAEEYRTHIEKHVGPDYRRQGKYNFRGAWFKPT